MIKLAKSAAIALAGVLVMITCQSANAQPLSQEDLRDLRQQIIQSIPKEVIQEIKQQLVDEIKKELITELKKELIGSGKPQAQQVVKDLLASQNSGTIKAALAAVQGGGNGDINSMLAALGRQLMNTRSNSRGGGLSDEDGHSTPLNGDPVAIVTNTSNPMTSLTVEQIRKLYTGEYTNWKQVGGPNLPVKVVVWSDSLGSLESVMKATVTSETVKLSYLSLMIPAVDRVKGAIDFLPTANMEQLQFVTGHKALKKLAVKADDEAPAVVPSMQAVKQGTYPVVAEKVGTRSGVQIQRAASISLSDL